MRVRPSSGGVDFSDYLAKVVNNDRPQKALK